jgi:hypothetical protein
MTTTLSFGIIPSQSYVYLIAFYMSTGPRYFFFNQGVSDPTIGVFQSSEPVTANPADAPVLLPLKIVYDSKGVTFEYKGRYLSYADGNFNINSINPQYFLLSPTGYNVNNSIVYSGLSYDFLGIISFNYEVVANHCGFYYASPFICVDCGKCTSSGNYSSHSGSFKFMMIPSEIYNSGTLSLPYKFNGTTCIADSNVKSSMTQNIKGNVGCSLGNDLNCIYSNSADCFGDVNTIYCSDTQVCSTCLGLCPNVQDVCLFDTDYSSYFCFSSNEPTPPPTNTVSPSGTATPTATTTVTPITEESFWDKYGVIIIISIVIIIVIIILVVVYNKSKKSSSG